MHEYTIVDSLLESALHHAHVAQARRVNRLRVSVGELSGVDPALLRKAYETFRERTLCESAELVIETVPATWSCAACGAPVARGSVLACPACGGAPRLSAGGEIFLDRIEMEVPDV